MNNAEWYVNWFNSPYYHLLYNNRNYTEANFFIDNLCSELKLEPGSKIWDLACGKGRHSIALNKKGFDVIGTDLSENNIREAKLNENKTLHFFEHDMRTHFSEQNFDAVFNLFTSIGYFQDFNDNFLVFKNVAAALKPGGVFVVDFFNSKKVESEFKSNYTEQRGDVHFDIKKKIENHAIRKRIEFSTEDKNYFFEESVSLLNKNDFENFAKSAGLSLCNIYGNYRLEDFNAGSSERLILIFKK
jgi:cyclopropane fatty-acyl-phospholipid synthase-like methyltransferase